MKPHLFGSGPAIMGVVNVTPDSFFDGGKFSNIDKAIEHGLQLISDGSDIIDVGGESTRPGAQEIDAAEEIARVVPVVKALAGKARWLSIDTRKAAVMEAALQVGANVINDISAFRHDKRAIDMAAEAHVPLCVMHMKGSPVDMQENPTYNNVVEEIYQFLQARITYFETRRIDAQMLFCDPGLGFGKSLEHNLLILRNISRFHDLGVPIMLGISRKSMIAKISKAEAADDRLAGSLSAAIWGLSQGVQIYRVHDVKETRQAFKVYEAIAKTDQSSP